MLLRNFADLAGKVNSMGMASGGDLVVDIGSNDGSLLRAFANQGLRLLGVEPTDAAKDALGRGIPTVQSYFTDQLVTDVLREHGQATIVTAANVLAHIEDLAAVLARISRLLAKGGIFISESHYLLDLVEENQYDTIYHEHLRYYHLGSLERAFAAAGMTIFAAQRIPTHGGSIRVYASNEAKSMETLELEDCLAQESEFGLDSSQWHQGFVEGIRRSKVDLFALLGETLTPETKVIGVGSPSRASTLVSIAGLDSSIIDAVLEHPDSPKCGRNMPGTSIPVVAEDSWNGDRTQPLLFLSWHIAEEILPKLRNQGYSGEALVPLPAPRVI